MWSPCGKDIFLSNAYSIQKRASFFKHFYQKIKGFFVNATGAISKNSKNKTSLEFLVRQQRLDLQLRHAQIKVPLRLDAVEPKGDVTTVKVFVPSETAGLDAVRDESMTPWIGFVYTVPEH